MDSDQYENNNKNKGNHKVTSVGNSWIVCRSKSHSGHVYYFNTLTGEAAWNLSDAEVEKAKKNLQNGVLNESCPEPKEPPMDQSNQNNANRNRNFVEQMSTPSKIYNKQIINNQFTKQAYPFSQFLAPCNYMMPSGGCMNPRAQIALTVPTPSFDPNVWAVQPPHQLLLASTPIVNHGQPPNVVFSNPNHNVFVHNSSVPLSKRFGSVQNTEYNNNSQQKHFTRNNKFTSKNNNRYGQRRDGNFQRMFLKNYNSNNDLRQVLSLKRSKRKNIQSRNEEIEDAEDINNSFTNRLDEDSQSNTRQGKHTEETHEDHYQSDADNDWLEENLSFKGTKLHLDVTNLKKLAKSNAKEDCWYIAADKTILTSHLNFLNILINSDEQCHLMVPKKVLDDLRVIAGTCQNMPRLRRRARRAVDFLSQLSEAGSCVIGDDGTECDYDNDYVVNCCINLVQNNYHVVLLSNNPDIKRYKISSIPIFNIKDLKTFLSNDREDQEPSPEPLPQPPKIPMKITIPNDFCKISNESLSTNNDESYSDIDTSIRENSANTQINVQRKEIVSTSNKPTIDTEVQTETKPDQSISPTDPCENINDVSQIDPVNDIQPSCNLILTLNRTVEANNAIQVNRSKNLIIFKPSESQTSLGTENTVEKSVEANNATQVNKTQKQILLRRSESQASVGTENTIEKRGEANNVTEVNRSKRQIRLKRSKPQTSVGTENSVEIKQFKWRRRRDGSCTQTNETRLHSTSTCAPRLPSTSDLISPKKQLNTACVQAEDNYHEIVTGTQLAHQVSYDSISQESNNVEGSETSSCVYVHRNIGEITIEETSTSGVISNTSRGNSDCGSIPKVKLIPNGIAEQQQGLVIENRMFEVTNKAMEDYLKMRREEWVSRFVQTMEEVLAQVLHEDPLFLKTMIPPPWTLLEATQCIKMRFSKDGKILDAATKLLNLLSKISDDKGRISKNLLPSKFMEMYSYGVYLVNVLQSAVESREDLQTAAENLTLLLVDIQSPNLDYSHNESFGDNPVDTSDPTIQVTSTNEPSVQSNDFCWGNKRKGHLDNDFSDVNRNTEKQYNLRSKKRKIEEDTNAEQQTVKFVRQINIESTFFNSLHLQKKAGEELNKPNNASIPLSLSNNKDCSPNSQTVSSNANSEDSNKVSTGPKFVRKLTACPQFESQLEQSITRQPVDMDELDYSDNYNDYRYEYGKYIDERFSSDGDYNDNEETEPAIEEAIESGRKDEPLHPVVKLDDNNNVILVLRNFIKEIKESFSQVKGFCEQTRVEYTVSEPDLSRRNEIHEKAEKAHVYIDNLCKSLSSLFNRESSKSENSIQSLLKQAGVHNLDLSDRQFVAGYREIVANCIDNANALLESLNVIITAVKS